MRHIEKRWQDKRPGWTRRITWYEGKRDVRLKMEDEFGTANRQYVNRDIAEEAWLAFIMGDLTTVSAREAG
jgi:hypothetical protein